MVYGPKFGVYRGKGLLREDDHYPVGLLGAPCLGDALVPSSLGLEPQILVETLKPCLGPIWCLFGYWGLLGSLVPEGPPSERGDPITKVDQGPKVMVTVLWIRYLASASFRLRGGSWIHLVRPA